jgi:chemotaxis signal transduction protein
MSAERMLVARAGAEYFAFPLGAVLEALDGAEVEAVPLVPRGVLGQCMHRGALLPVLDPQAALGAALDRSTARPLGGGELTILVMVADEPFAIAMDDVTDMVNVEASACRAVPTGADRGGMIRGLLAHDGILAALVDLDSLHVVASSLLSPDTR